MLASLFALRVFETLKKERTGTSRCTAWYNKPSLSRSARGHVPHRVLDPIEKTQIGPYLRGAYPCPLETVLKVGIIAENCMGTVALTLVNSSSSRLPWRGNSNNGIVRIHRCRFTLTMDPQSERGETFQADDRAILVNLMAITAAVMIVRIMNA